MPYFHVWFATKRRKWLLQGDVSEAAKGLLRSTATDKGIRLIEVEAVVDHIHLLLDLPNKSVLPEVMMNLKGVSARRLFERFPELRLDARTQSFWQAGYGAKLIPASAVTAARHYIRTQWQRLDGYERSSMPRGSARGTVPRLKDRRQP